jgi:LacI family transcriptional regulator
MAELAAAVGYSRVTVSKALNGHSDVPDSTRQLIFQRAAELGYRPNAAARSMGKGSTGMLSLVVTTHSTSTTYGGLLRGIQRALEPRDLLLTANEFRFEELDDPAFSPRLFRELVSDGILLDCLHEVPGFAAAAQRVHIPLVYLNHRREHDAAYPDDRGGAGLGTRELISRGHRRILYLDQPSPHYSSTERREGYLAAMLEAGLEPRVLAVPYFNRQPGAITEQVEGMLTGSDAPTAVLTYHARQAGATLTAAIRCGRRPGEDLAILSFNGQLITETGLAIATLRIPFAEVGAAAVELLLAKIAADGSPQPARRLAYPPIEVGETLC